MAVGMCTGTMAAMEKAMETILILRVPWPSADPPESYSGNHGYVLVTTEYPGTILNSINNAYALRALSS